MHKEILSSLNTPLIILDNNNLIKFVNPSLEEFISLSKTILINNSLLKFIDSDSPIFMLVNRVRKSNNSLSEESLILSSKTFSQKEVKVNIMPVFDIDNYIIIQIEELINSKKKLSFNIHDKISKSFSSMVSMLMHELKNPLSGIIGATQLLEKDITNKNLVELTDVIKLETKRISSVLANFENITDSSREIPCNYLNIHEVLKHCIKVANNSFGKNLSLIEDYDPSLPYVFGNHDLLIQVFLNIIKNACEVKSTSGIVKIKTSFNSEKFFSDEGTIPRQKPLQIEIIDNGKGIEKELLTKVFEPFVTTKSKGKGLGLSVVVSGLNAMDASINLTTKENTTNFCVNFPMRKK